MLRSRMFTPGFRLFFGLSGVLLAGTLLFGVGSILQVEGSTVRQQLDARGAVETITGPLTAGWKGPVGNQLGYGVLLAAALVAGFIACVLVAFRDGDADALTEAAQTESVPLTRAPAGANYAPLVLAFSVALILIGWVSNTTVFYAGLALLALTMGTWTVRAWAERATGDDEVNRQIYHRIIDPLRVPVVGVAVIAFVVIGLSRFILAVPDKTTSSIVFGVAAVLIFGGVVLITFMPKVSRSLVLGLVILAGLVILGAGVYGVAKGERHIEPHGAPAGQSNEHGLAPTGTRAGA